MDEKKLIEGCLQNDRKSQKTLYELFSPKMLALCLRYADSQEEAEDAMIEGFTNVFNNLTSYRGEAPLESWIRRIMVNSSLAHFRAKQKHRCLSLDEIAFEEADESAVKPEDKFGEKDLLQLIQKMPEGYKIIFNLFAVEGFSHKEIAEQLQITESTSKSQFFRARKWLMERLKNE
ncbi:MAG: sigma-70 family RNA polymerase sigma factor [Bacteroidales bacterium]|nr:sigma-70 family RNA polymerase sigma factor [Bacteroidales bacterium]